MGKLGYFLDFCGCLLKSGENCANISSLLHRYDSELILFVDPDKEGLLIVMENTTTFWPVSVEAACLKESISFLKKEMVIDELLLLCSSHRSKRIESASELTFEGVASLHNFLFNLVSLLS